MKHFTKEHTPSSCCRFWGPPSLLSNGTWIHSLTGKVAEAWS
jgi:hypothetical protein